jgi:hypothetical protein
MVPELAKALGDAVLVLHRKRQKPLGHLIDDLVDRLEAARLNVKAEKLDPLSMVTQAIRAWEKPRASGD